MNRTAKAKLSVVVASIVLFAASAINAKQESQTQQPTGQQPKPAEGAQAQPKPETLQILKGMPRPQIIAEMRKIAAALGVGCNFCHINPFDAETPRKQVARLMMRGYTMGMKHKDGSAVGCADCHKGQPNLLRTLPFDGAVGKQTPSIQVLKGLSKERLMEVMTSVNKALGVECNYCHTSKFDEETPRKQIARFMMTQFSMGLVKQDGGAVSCNVCHQGHAKLLSVLPFPERPERRAEPQQPPKKPNG